MEKYVFGWIATGLGFLYKLPQMYKLYKVKKDKSISKLSYSLQSLSYVIYVLHGYFNNDNPIIVMGFLSLLQNFIIWCLFIYIKNINNKTICEEIEV